MPMNLEDYAGYPLIDAGDYEFSVSAEIKKAKNSNVDYLSVAFKIREDVDQKFKNTVIFESFFRDKDNPEWFDLRKSGALIVTQKGKPDYTNKFDDVEEFVQYINGIHCIASVEVVFDDNLNRDVNRIIRRSYKPSKWDTEDHPVPEKKPQPEGVKDSANLDKIEIDPNKLPF